MASSFSAIELNPAVAVRTVREFELVAKAQWLRQRPVVWALYVCKEPNSAKAALSV